MSEPIVNIELEFIEGVVCGYTQKTAVKIIINKEFDAADNDDIFYLNKFVLPPMSEGGDVLQQFMYYMSQSIYMSTSIYMGGLDIESIASTIEAIDISEPVIAGENYVIDWDVDPNSVNVYNIRYKYNGVWYTTDYVAMYKPIALEGFIQHKRTCITLRNLRYRGVNERQKYNYMFQEASEDLYRMNNQRENIKTLLPTLTLSPEILSNFMALRKRTMAIRGC